MALRDFAHDAIVPLRGPPLLLVLVVTPLTGVAQAAGMFGVPLLAILAGWVWSYTYLMIEATAEGHDAPVLAIERTNPWHEPRALFPPLVVLFASWIAAGPAAHAGATTALVVATCGVLLLPACLALIAAGCGLDRALWPPALFSVIGGLGTRYVAVLLLAAAYAAAIDALLGRVPLFLLAAPVQLALYSVGAALGGSLYRRRRALDLDPLAAPERQQDRSAAQASREAEAVAAAIYGLLRVKREAEAWRAADDWLRAAPEDPTPCRWLRDRALVWGEQRFADRLEGALVSRLVGANRLGEAIGAIEACWARAGTLPPRPAAERRVLQAAALRMGQEATASRLDREPVQDTSRG